MPQSLKNLMTRDPITVPADALLYEAARLMKERDIGDVIVTKDDEYCGIVTDRDIVVRALAEGRAPGATKIGDICSQDLVTLSADDDVDTAVALMRDRALRRLPVTQGAELVGVVTLGDLAQERDPKSALAGISAAPPNA